MDDAATSMQPRRGDVDTVACPQHGARTATCIVAGRNGPGIWSRCTVCEEAEHAARAESERRYAEQEAARANAERISEGIAESGIRGRYLRATFETFDVGNDPAKRRALAAVKAYANALRAPLRPARFGRQPEQPAAPATRPPGTLFLIGGPGTGKTHLAAATVRHAIEHRQLSAEIITASALVAEVRSTWRRDAQQTELDVISRLARRSLLVLDDLGAGFGTEAEAKTLLDVIDRRYTEERHVVVVSNLDEQGIRATVGERTFDRLREGARSITFTWPSHRGRQP